MSRTPGLPTKIVYPHAWFWGFVLPILVEAAIAFLIFATGTWL